MSKYSRVEALSILAGEAANFGCSNKVIRTYKKQLRAAFNQARDGRRNVYLPFPIGGYGENPDQLLRFEVKGAHLKKRLSQPRYPYAHVVHVYNKEERDIL